MLLSGLLAASAAVALQPLPKIEPRRPPAPLVVAPVLRRPAPDFIKAFEASNACRRAYIGQDYVPQPAIWRIANGDRPMFILGTVHLLPMSFDWRSPQLDTIINEVDSLITETGRDDPAAFATALTALAPVGTDGRVVPVADRLTGERRIVWTGMSAMLPEVLLTKLNNSPTWLAALVIGSLPDGVRSPRISAGVDNQLERIFATKRKKVTSIEDFQTVLSSLKDLPTADQQQLLNGVMDSIGKARPSLAERMKDFHNWGRGLPLDRQNFFEGSDLPIVKALGERLLARRNAAWVTTVKQRLAQPGSTLVAVGAAHLHGSGSLIELLAKEGIKAERISPTTPASPRPAFQPKPASWETCDQYMTGQLKPSSGGK